MLKYLISVFTILFFNFSVLRAFHCRGLIKPKQAIFAEPESNRIWTFWLRNRTKPNYTRASHENWFRIFGISQLELNRYRTKCKWR